MEFDNASIIPLGSNHVSDLVVRSLPGAYTLLVFNGDTPADLADRMSIGIETAWSYCKDAVKQLAFPRSKMRELGEGLIARDLWRLLVKMWEEDDDRLDARLNDLFEAVEEELTEDGAYARRGWSKGELAFARQMIVSQA